MKANHGELILYRTEDGRTELHLRAADGTVWLTQAELAELFDTTPQNITQHIRGIYEEGELAEGATCKDDLQVRTEGGREGLGSSDRIRRRTEAVAGRSRPSGRIPTQGPQVALVRFAAQHP